MSCYPFVNCVVAGDSACFEFHFCTWVIQTITQFRSLLCHLKNPTVTNIMHQLLFYKLFVHYSITYLRIYQKGNTDFSFGIDTCYSLFLRIKLSEKKLNAKLSTAFESYILRINSFICLYRKVENNIQLNSLLIR